MVKKMFTELGEEWMNTVRTLTKRLKKKVPNRSHRAEYTITELKKYTRGG